MAVRSASWDEEAQEWRIQTDGGEELRADVFVSAVGQLSQPQIPALAGLDTFRGPAFHSARWNHDFQPAGRRVAVVGNGASAIQLVPPLAKTAEKVFVFQRSPNWIVHRHDYAYPRLVQGLFRWLPGAARLTPLCDLPAVRITDPPLPTPVVAEQRFYLVGAAFDAPQGAAPAAGRRDPPLSGRLQAGAVIQRLSGIPAPR